MTILILNDWHPYVIYLDEENVSFEDFEKSYRALYPRALVYLLDGDFIDIQGKKVAKCIFTIPFDCHIPACKGACCHLPLGTDGGPLSEEEYEITRAHTVTLNKLTGSSKCAPVVYRKNGQPFTCQDDQEKCVLCITDEEAKQKGCALSVLHKKGDSSLYRPYSCWVYPVDEDEDKNLIVEGNWFFVCHEAFRKGQVNNHTIYDTARSALLKKFGSDFIKECDKWKTKISKW